MAVNCGILNRAEAMDSGLAGRTVIVTGASGGIGQEVVRQFLAEDAKVVLHFFSGRERAEQLCRELDSPSIYAVQADLRDEDSVANLFNQTEKRFGAIDVLVANAGVWPADHVPIQEMSIERWNATLAVDMTSVFLCVREMLRRSEANSIESPAIVMIGSTAGEFGEAGHADYAAAKSSLMNGLLASLKNEIVERAPQGRINAVCPGWTITSMARELTQDPVAMTRALQTIPLRKFGKPRDVASAVVFLSSNRLSGHITGQSLFVDGGMEGRVLFNPEEIDLESATKGNSTG